MHKRQIFYLALYGAEIAGTAVFVALSYRFGQDWMAKLASIFIILWIPLILVTILSAQPQTVAGNVFYYLRNKNADTRREKLSTYCSEDFYDSESFARLIGREQYAKPTRITRAKDGETRRGEKSYRVQLRDFTRYRVVVIRRDPERELRYTTRWVVDSVEPIKEK